MFGEPYANDLPQARQLRGWSSICVIASFFGKPVKICYGKHPKHALNNAQVGATDKLTLQFNIWVADSRIARRLQKGCFVLLDKANKRLRGDWFDIDVERAEKLIRHVAEKEGIPVFTNADVNQMIESGLMETLAPPAPKGAVKKAKDISRIISTARSDLRRVLS